MSQVFTSKQEIINSIICEQNVRQRVIRIEILCDTDSYIHEETHCFVYLIGSAEICLRTKLEKDNYSPHDELGDMPTIEF